MLRVKTTVLFAHGVFFCCSFSVVVMLIFQILETCHQHRYTTSPDEWLYDLFVLYVDLAQLQN